MTKKKRKEQMITMNGKEFYGDDSIDSILEGQPTAELAELLREQYETAKAMTEHHIRLLKEILAVEV